MKNSAVLLLLAALGGAAFADENLTLDALVKGAATGKIDNAMAKKIQAKTQSTSPVFMAVKVLKRYTQPGCGRLDYIVRQADVIGKDGKLHPLMIEWQMNICKDGSPPVPPLSAM